MFKFWGSQEEQVRPPQHVTTQSWYPPSVSSSRPATPGSTSSNHSSSQRLSGRPQSPSHVSPAEAAGIISALKDKSVDELRKLLSDKDAYNQFLLSLDQVKIQNNLKDELRKETLQLASENVEKEPRIMELRNQCRIIRTTELAAAEEKLNELDRKKEDIMKLCSPASLLKRLQERMKETEEESEKVHMQLLEREIDLSSFTHKYKKLRMDYHRRALIQLAARTTSN
ncbi:vacuolar protein-sorting-associated protein 37 homolog 1-like [Cucurbita moschata]|uniref:Vacuolar protein-sorting-associated protein 37 homolog 1-like n=2 Tax=Cucurbita TaxID=3660 RepID=A0A6J1F5W3_CUCMO